ncbi:MAG: hypothetical protein Q9186_001397 [Xanthomendoza sp. 1 TL-2023]
MRPPFSNFPTSLKPFTALITSIAITMPTTRGSHGITAPRVPFVPTADPESRQTTTTTTTTKKKGTTASTAAKKVKAAAAKATTSTKANTSKPRAGNTSATAPPAAAAAAAAAGDKTATGRVTKAKTAPKAKKATTKKAAPKTKTVNKREPGLLDKVVGAKDIIMGTLEGKPGKKAAGTKKIRGTDGKGATRGKK